MKTAMRTSVCYHAMVLILPLGALLACGTELEQPEEDRRHTTPSEAPTTEGAPSSSRSELRVSASPVATAAPVGSLTAIPQAQEIRPDNELELRAEEDAHEHLPPDAALATTRAAATSSGPRTSLADKGQMTSPKRATALPSRGPIYKLPPSCNPNHLTLTRWPLDGTNGRHWMINNYLDLDAASGTRDYLGFINAFARTYNGHRGVDVDIPSFREMDNNKAVVRAAAAGEVVFVRENQFDRNTISLSGCTATWNVVRVEHANGFSTVYGHLKQNSVPVQVGDTVQAGAVLGVAGSSGCSTAPHLHFEVRDCDNNRLESFQLGMWQNPPVYHPASRVMDVMLRAGAGPSVAQIKDPAPNVSVVKPNATIGIGLSMTGHGGDVVNIRYVRPNGTVFRNWNWTVSGNTRVRHLFPSWSNTIGADVGKWRIEVRVNNAFLVTRTIGVSNYSPGLAEIAKHHVHDSSYETVFADITAAGYRPIWVDGYKVGGSTYFNAIFRPEDGTGWIARHNLSSASYQSWYDNMPAGYRPLQIDSYRRGSGVRYALILVKKGGPTWTAYHGRTASQHQDLFHSLKGQGYRPVNVSVVSVNGTRYWSALYDKAAVGSFMLKSSLNNAQYQGWFDSQKAAGRYLAYINGYTHNGQSYISAIWNSVPVGAYAARHNLSFSGYQNEWSAQTGNGRLTRFVSGYAWGNTPLFAALWSSN